MKKTTKYSRKRAAGHTFNAAQFLNVIDRCRTYTDEPIIGGIVKEGTATAANKAELRTQAAARDLIDHNKPLDPEQAFDVLSHALGVSIIRAIQIEPVEEKNPALPILKAGTQAVERSIARYQRDGSWGMDATGKLDLADAIDVYVQILRSSSPAQMTKATDERTRIIQAMYARHKQQKENA
jgi:hypothetical protein